MIAVLLVLVAVAAFLDAVRRPASQWVEADRNKGFWLTMIVILNVFGVAAYALFVLPRFPRDAGQVDAGLLKSAAKASERKKE